MKYAECFSRNTLHSIFTLNYQQIGKTKENKNIFIIYLSTYPAISSNFSKENQWRPSIIVVHFPINDTAPICKTYQSVCTRWVLNLPFENIICKTKFVKLRK